MTNQDHETTFEEAFTNALLRLEPTASLQFWENDIAYITKMEDGVLKTKQAKQNKDLSWEWI